MKNLFIQSTHAASLKSFLERYKDPSNQSLDNINQAVLDITNLVLSFAGAIAAIFFLYGCFLYMTSFGDDSKAESAKKTIIYSLVGLAVIIACKYIVQTVGIELHD